METSPLSIFSSLIDGSLWINKEEIKNQWNTLEKTLAVRLESILEKYGERFNLRVPIEVYGSEFYNGPVSGIYWAKATKPVPFSLETSNGIKKYCLTIEGLDGNSFRYLVLNEEDQAGEINPDKNTKLFISCKVAREFQTGVYNESLNGVEALNKISLLLDFIENNLSGKENPPQNNNSEEKIPF